MPKCQRWHSLWEFKDAPPNAGFPLWIRMNSIAKSLKQFFNKNSLVSFLASACCSWYERSSVSPPVLPGTGRVPSMAFSSMARGWPFGGHELTIAKTCQDIEMIQMENRACFWMLLLISYRLYYLESLFVCSFRMVLVLFVARLYSCWWSIVCQLDHITGSAQSCAKVLGRIRCSFAGKQRCRPSRSWDMLLIGCFMLFQHLPKGQV